MNRGSVFKVFYLPTILFQEQIIKRSVKPLKRVIWLRQYNVPPDNFSDIVGLIIDSIQIKIIKKRY